MKKLFLFLVVFLLVVSVACALTTIELDKTNLIAGDTLKVTITPDAKGYLDKIYFYDNLNNLMYVHNLKCKKGICYDKKNFDFEIPNGWKGQYSIIVYDYGLHDYVKKEFSVDLLKEISSTLPQTQESSMLLGEDLELGWPKYYSDRMQEEPAEIAVGDLDCDNDLEIVVAGEYNGFLHVWHHDGTNVQGWPKSGYYYGRPALADLDNDCNLEIIISHDGYSSSTVYVFNHDGSNYPGWPKTTTTQLFWSPTIADLDGDNRPEIIVSGEDRLHAWHSDGSEMNLGEVEVIGGVGGGLTYLSVGDIDNDGLLELLRGEYALGDLDGDNDLEMVHTTLGGQIVAQHHDGSYVWSRLTNGATYYGPSLGDVDNDNLPEVIAGSHDGYLYVIDGDGSDIPGWPKLIGNGAKPVYFSLADIDNDNDLEIFVSTMINGYLFYAFHHDGSNVEGWPKQTEYAEQSSSFLGDIDNDGSIEVVVSDFRAVYVWDMGGYYNPLRVEWPMFQHDTHHSGLYTKTFSTSLLYGWNMISLPARPVDPNPAVVFNGISISGNLHRYDHAKQRYVTYQDFAPSEFGLLKMGEGYWFNCLKTTGCDLQYETYGDSGNLEINLPTRGWYLIGTSNNNINFADILVKKGTETRTFSQAANVWIQDPFMGYNNSGGSYFFAGIAFEGEHYLRPWYGYWVYTFEDDINLILPE